MRNPKIPPFPVPPQGLEPWTRGLRVRCSSQLSYKGFAAKLVGKYKRRSEKRKRCLSLGVSRQERRGIHRPRSADGTKP